MYQCVRIRIRKSRWRIRSLQSKYVPSFPPFLSGPGLVSCCVNVDWRESKQFILKKLSYSTHKQTLIIEKETNVGKIEALQLHMTEIRLQIVSEDWIVQI